MASEEINEPSLYKWNEEIPACVNSKPLKPRTRIPFTTFRIDNGTYEQSNITFLSHFHSDHLNGLTKKKNPVVFATDTTCKILQKTQAIPIVKSVTVNESIQYVPMEYNRAYVFTNAGAKKGNSKIKTVEKFLSRLPSSHRPPYQIYPTLGVNSDSDSPLLRVLLVVAIDANHCPGSCMFSFSLYEGSKLTDMANIFSMLYTGDFRISPQILSFVQGASLSLLHVDDTCYSKPNYHPLQLNDAVDLATRFIRREGTEKKVCFCCGVMRKEEFWMETVKALEKELPGGIYLDFLHWEYREFFIPRGSSIERRLVRDMAKAKYFIMDGKDALSVPGPRVVIDADSNKAKNNTEGYCYIGYGRHCSKTELESFITATRYCILSSIYNKIPKEKHRSVEDWTRVFK
ncbi:hypothetical protein WA577_001749, partial [Blastocystis sp. JDR]